MRSASNGGSGAFTSTNWSVVLRAGLNGELQRDSLAEICRRYWYPLYAYLRATGVCEEDAKDYVQSFFANLCQGTLSRADPARGRFRSFLLTALKNFVANEVRNSRAQKRGGDRQTVSLDTAAGDLEQRFQMQHRRTQDPELLFELGWVSALLTEVQSQLERSYAESGRQVLFQHLSPYLTGQSPQQPLAELAEQLQTTPSALNMALHRLRQRFGKLLREEIAKTVTSDSDVDGELQHLMSLFGRASR